MINKPIPVTKPLDWQCILALPITPKSEPLVDTQCLSKDHIYTQSDYLKQGIAHALPTCYLRESLIERLRHAASLLPAGVYLMILDGWRPVALQQELIRQVGLDIKARFKHESEAKQQEILSLFVAEPSTDPQRPSPHLTGGSVDLTLCDASGTWLDMGSGFDEPVDASWTAALEALPASEAQKNRRLLYWAMIESGFSNLSTEWWHFDYGNQLWAYYTDQERAFFSVAKP